MKIHIVNLLAIVLLILKTEVNGDTRSQIIINARDYISKFKEVLSLGSCPTREIIGDDGSADIVPCFEKYNGQEIFIPMGTSTVSVKRVRSAEDVATLGAGGLGFGVSIFGLVGVNAKGKVAVTTETNGKELTLMNNYRTQRGVITLTHARPDKNVTPPNPYYLSEIVLGGEETLLVTMEFNSEKQRTEVEGTVGITLLFIPISKTISHVVESPTIETAAVAVHFLSTWRKSETLKFEGPESLSSALKVVEDFEKKMQTSSIEFEKLDNEDSNLHLEYHFSAWKTDQNVPKVNPALANFHIRQLTKQLLEIQSVLYKIQEYLESEKYEHLVNKDIRKQLNSFRSEMKDLETKLETVTVKYSTMTEKEQVEILNETRMQRAPCYYQRKLNFIFTPSVD